MIDSFNSCNFSTLVELLRYRALHQSERTAYTFLRDGETEEVSLSYQQLEQRAQAIAAKLQFLAEPGERALLLYPPGLEFIEAFFGCLLAGVVAVPAYPPRPNQSLSRLQAIVADAQATLALTTTAVLSNIERKLAQSALLQALRCLATDSIPSDSAQQWLEPAGSGNTLALLQYTSGSTGSPKGVMLSHRNLLHNSAAIRQCFKNTPDTKGVSWLPPYHDMGLIGGILQPLYVGAQMVLMSPADFLQRPLRWLMAISRYRATTSGGPNFAYDLCLRKIAPEQRANLDLSGWEVAFNGAEPVRAETLEQFAVAFQPCGFRASAFYPCYGMAETTLIVSGGIKEAPPVLKTVQEDALQQNRVVAAVRNSDAARTLVSCGQTCLEQKIVIADPETLTSCSPLEVGEIWVSGASVAQGYWNQPLETERTFRAYLADTGEGPFLRTGDLGFLQDGELFVTGRIKDLIIIRGRNYYPQDIELTAQESHPALRAGCGAAFSVDVDREERLVIAFEVERQYLRKLDADAVVKNIRQAVAEQHDLEVYAILLIKTNSIPKTSSGKIQRYACRTGFLNNSLEVVSDWTNNPRMKAEYRHLIEEVEVLERHLQNRQLNSASGGDNNAAGTASCEKVCERAEAIRDWLVSKITELLKVSPHEIDVRQPLTSYGLDSVAAVNLSGQMEDWLGCRLSPTLLYEHPTIESIAQHLSSAPGSELLALVDNLSEEEVDSLLNKLLN
jgi:acyl-CoA synthetase (AMP-forming)/AMP-acid ligase II/acyl carrier protein